MVAPSATHSVQDVLTYVKRQFGDESGVQIVDTDIVRWINQGSMELISKNPIIQSVAPVLYQTQLQGFLVPDDVLQIEAVTWNANPARAELPFDPIFSPYAINFQGTPLKAVDMSEGMRQREQIGTTGEPIYWYTWGNVVFLVPQPSDFTRPVFIYYDAAPGPVATAGDLLSIPDRYYDKLLMFIMSKAYELDQDWQAHSTQRAAFEEELSNLNFVENSTQGSYPTIRSTDDGYW